MSRKLLIALAPLALVFALLGMPAAHAVDKDCGHFSNQKKAQIFFLNHGGPQNDPHRLDDDGDGIACESNPCPCYKKKTLPDGDGGGSGGGGGKDPVVQYAKITRVVDGDTVKVRLASGGRKTVRMIGIDTPEMSPLQCGAKKATKALKKRAPRGTKVKLVSDPTQDLKDRYDRILRYVIKRKGTRDLNRSQIYLGWAKVYVYDNPFERVKSYRTAQSQANNANRGVWGSC